MDRSHHCKPAFFCEPAQEVHHLDPVAHIKRARRLVEEEDPGVLRKRTRDEHPLPLPSREAVGPAGRKVTDAEEGERFRDLLFVFFGDAPAQVRPPAHQDGSNRRQAAPLF